MTSQSDPIRGDRAPAIEPDFSDIDFAEIDAAIARARRMRAEAMRDTALAIGRAPGAIAALIRSAFARIGRA